MNNQDRLFITTIIENVPDTGERIINLEEVNTQVFRNLYHIAKNLESDLNVEIIDPGKTIRIFRSNL